MLLRPLAFLGRHATTALALCLLIGIVAQPLAALLRPALALAVAALLLFTMIRVEWSAVLGYRHRPFLVLGLLGWMLVLSPLLVASLATQLPLGPGLTTALVLMAASCSLSSTPALATMLGLDGALGLVVMVGGTLLLPFTLPLVAVGLLGLDVAVDAFGLWLRLAGLIGGAAIIAVAVRQLLGRDRLAAHAEVLDGLIIMALIVFAIAIVDGLTSRLLAQPLFILGLAGLTFAASFVHLAAGTLVFALAGRQRALTAGYVLGNRNLGVLLAVLPAGAHPDIFLYFVVGQLPIYLWPAILAPLYRRFLRP
jgi:BASS family bile acid:Na+ symporter